ncbi:MAG: GNAT family N-acetyltransferase [Oscillospiraceae bacterium]|nr:GNAT family N-acetyltransferase [Oscillospiraceae bacterium]
MEIRRATGADAAGVYELNNLFNGAGWTTLEKTQKSLESNTGEIVLVAIDGETYAGFCCCAIIRSLCYAEPYCEFTEIYVREDYRRAGVGTALTDRMESECKKLGIHHFHLAIAFDNINSKNMCEKLNYEQTAYFYEKTTSDIWIAPPYII